ncbi:MAG: Flp pilus assembly protein CpaB [Alphaproteobacteria bacterium]
MARVFLRLALLFVVTVAVVVAGQRWFLADDAETAPKVATTPVRVASTDLPVGTFVDEVEAPFEDRPDAELEPDWITAEVAARDDILGAVVIEPVKAGEPLTREALLMPGQDGFLAAVLRPGLRAVSVAVDAVSGNAGHVFPGDRVDIILTQRLEAEGRRDGAWASETILEAVRVIAVDQNLEEDLSAREQARVPRTFTLEVTPDDVERIAVASELGRLSFSLRSLVLDESGGEVGAGDDRATYAIEVSRALRPVPEAEASEPTPAPREVRVLRGKRAGGRR